MEYLYRERTAFAKLSNFQNVEAADLELTVQNMKMKCCCLA